MINEILWIVAIIIFCVIEALTAGLVSIWFAGGALCALIGTLFGASLQVQILLFLTISAVFIIALRKIAVKGFKLSREKTNTDRIIGKEVIITQTVDNRRQSGKATINDVEWKVRSENGDIIESGEVATVSKIEGVKLIVTK